MKKVLISLALMAGIAFAPAQAAELSHTQSWGSSQSVSNLDTKVTGNVNELTVKYANDRGDFAKPTTGCGTACPGTGNVDNSVVSASLSVQQKVTTMDERTTGKVVTDESYCDTSITGGIITATQGKRDSHSVIDTVTAKNNVTEISGYAVKVDTSTNKGDGYPGKGKGNDVNVQLDNGASFNTYGDFSVSLAKNADGSLKAVNGVTIGDWSPSQGTENGVGYTVTNTNLTVKDTGYSTEKGNSYSATSYSSLK